ncbi:uncharacterized protein EAE98_004629 [Botrytis deweyae]|uniref:Uncharacterized protein n=1 Tax=Botrytis deweyae TaxID=2478750 RepID=A0ABQ7IRE7_9HELO|nr:uncharacterized protein EAE98_004629 [Botrytis deweyae]KAF7931893.1 hypothetical protein EAE98_004629 [Botrytis deweyae]
MPFQVEKLQLQTLLRERVFVTWANSAGEPLTLGSCSHRNKNNPEFIMEAGYDMEGHIHIHFFLTVTIKFGGKKQPLEMLLVVPPNANFANAPIPLTKLNANDLPLPDDLPLPNAFVLHEAGISESGHVILVPFNLTTKGFVIMDKTPPIIRPCSGSTTQLIRSLESLSNTSIFNVCIRPSDYAREGLKELCKRLSNTGSILAEWDKVKYHDRQDVQPPPYTDNPARPVPKVQVPRSPPITLEMEKLPYNTVEIVVAETSNQTPVNSNPAPVLHGIISPGAGEPSSVDLRDVEGDSRCIDVALDVGSDEALLANLNSRKPSQQLKDEAVSKMLESKSWCSAILLYDPFDSDNTIGLWEERNRWLISDIAKLIKWANTFHYGAEINSLLINDFVKLGSVARNFALHPGNDKAEYIRQRSVCVVRVWTEFGKSKRNISGDTSGPGSRKRDDLETDSNMSRRARNIV